MSADSPGNVRALRIVWVGADSRSWSAMEYLQRTSPEIRLETAADAEEARTLLERLPADLVVFERDRENGAEEWGPFFRWTREQAQLDCALLIQVAQTGWKTDNTAAEADGTLTHPISRDDVARYFRIARRLAAITEGPADPAGNRLAVRCADRKRVDGRILEVFEIMLDLGLPGARQRGEWIESRAIAMARKFEVPETYLDDLRVVARFHEIGHILEGERAKGRPHRPAAGGDHSYVLATRSLFLRIRGLEAAAQIAGSIFENWDGSGHPRHLLRGEIPLRSRILRVLVDHQSLAERACLSSTDILETMEQHAGTYYDRMALVFLKEVLDPSQDAEASKRPRLVPVAELQPGMILAEDLFSDAGIKLLARGTTLGRAAIEIIMRRDAIDPILQGIGICPDSVPAEPPPSSAEKN